MSIIFQVAIPYIHDVSRETLIVLNYYFYTDSKKLQLK